MSASVEGGMAAFSEARARERIFAVMSSPVSAAFTSTPLPEATLLARSWIVTNRRSAGSYSFRLR